MGFEPTISWATARRLRPLGYAHRVGLPVATTNYKAFWIFRQGQAASGRISDPFSLGRDLRGEWGMMGPRIREDTGFE